MRPKNPILLLQIKKLEEKYGSISKAPEKELMPIRNIAGFDDKRVTRSKVFRDNEALSEVKRLWKSGLSEKEIGIKTHHTHSTVRKMIYEFSK